MIDQKLDQGIMAFLKENQDRMFRDIDAMLSIDSVTGEAEEGMPLGRAIDTAIDRMLGICARYGLKTRNIDGVIGEAVWGEGEGSVGVLTHVDIVPAGVGWSRPPFALTVEDGIMYGRGVIDDKGPGVAALYALLAALAAGAKISKRIVLLFGGDEESGMRCLKRYLQTEAPPDTAFSPDAGFPLIHCEKTIAHGSLSAVLSAGSALKAIAGGTRANVVPNHAQASLSAVRPGFAPPADVTLQPEGEGFVLTAKGVQAHGSTPDKGRNAISLLLSALVGALPEGDPAIEPLAGLHDLCAPSDGSGLGIACRDDASGPLTLNLGVIGVRDGSIRAEWDIRHPVTIDPEENLYQTLPKAAEARGWSAEATEHKTGMYLPEDHPLVATLMGAYNDLTGSNERPLAIGGGTYARMLPCAAAFGMLFEGDEETAHMADERVSVETFMQATRIYAHALAQLGA